MDEQEQVVERYLEGKKYQSIVFEPDGNITPDFLVDGEIAIEVRRLNQHYESESTKTGLEVDSIPLYQSVYNILGEFNGHYIDKTYFVFLKFRRPLQKGKPTKNLIKKALSEFAASPSEKRVELVINNNLTLKIVPAGTPHDGILFLMGGYSDQDSGGWVLSEMERNILICSEEKLNKVEKHRPKYPVWWLALVDHIGHGIGADEKKHLNNELLNGHNWDKVIVINPLNIEEAYEI